MNRFFAIVGLFLISASMLMGQLSTGTIIGVVKDPSGAAIPDATVTVTNTSTNIARTATTGSDGSYRFDAMTPGPYSLTVTKDGFNKTTLTSLTLEVAQTLEANATLQVGSVQQEVSVSAALAPQVNVTQSSLGGLVNDQQIADLPLNGRNFIDLALLQPGVANAVGNSVSGTSLSRSTWYSTNGAPIRANLVTLDGAPMLNLNGGTSDAVGATLGVDGIQEFRAITNSFGAQYGISMGSQIVIVSKGGTNQFHGDAFDYLRNDDLDAWGYFAKAQPKLVKNDFGGSFGGPIKKNNTFFYAVYEGIRQRQGVTSTVNTFPSNCNLYGPSGSAVLGLGQGSNPCSTSPFTYQGNSYNCATGCLTTSGSVNPLVAPYLQFYPLPNVGTSQYTQNNLQPESVNYGQIRVDHTFSAKDSMFGRYTIDKSNLLTAVTYPGTAYQGFGNATSGSDQYDSLAENHIISPALLNTSRVSFSRILDFVNPTCPAIIFQPQFEQVYDQPMTGGIGVTSGVFGVGCGGTAPQTFNSDIYTLSDDIYWTKGRHAFQFGTLLNRIEDYAYDHQNIGGGLTFANNAAMLAGNYLYNVQVPGSNYFRSSRFYTFGFYVQDDWRFNSRLTWNLGMRYEPDTTPHDRTGANWSFDTMTAAAPTLKQTMFRNASERNFEPRIGVAWDVRGNGKTAVRAAFGVYDDVDSFGQTIYGISAGSPPTSAKASFSGTLQNLPITTAANAIIPGTMPYGSSMKNAQYDIDQTRMYQWNISIQQQLTPSMAVTVAYVGSRGLHLWDNEEGNPCLPSSVTNGIPSWTPPNTVAPAGIVGGNPAGSLPNPLGSGFVSVVCNTVINPGTSSAHFLTSTYPAGASQPGSYIVPTRLNPLWGDSELATTNADSNYNGGQLSLTKRASHGLEAQVAYTYSRVIDDSQGQFSQADCQGSGGLPEQVLQPERNTFDRGPACFDVPQELQISFIYHLPKTNMGGFVGRELLSGWWLGNKTDWQTGFPFSPTSSSNWRSLDENDTTDSGFRSEYMNYGVETVAPGQTGVDGTVNTTVDTFIPYNKSTVIVDQKQKGVVQWYNPLMFTLNPIGQEGTVRKGVLRGPHYSAVDLSLNKDTAVPLFGEKGQLEFQIEAFNVFNHTNLAMPAYNNFTGNLTDVGIYSEVPLSTAGQITSIVGNPRQVQLSLKLIF